MDTFDFAHYNRYRAIDAEGNWKHGNDINITPDGIEIIDDSYSIESLRRTPIDADTLCVGYQKPDSQGVYIFLGDFVQTPQGLGKVNLIEDRWTVLTAAGKMPLDDCRESIAVIGNPWDTPELYDEWLASFPDTDEDL